MATAKKRTSGRNSAKKKQSKKQQESFRNEIILWVILAVSILIFISNFGIGGKIGNVASSFFFGIFGLMAYVFPVALFLGACFLISNQDNARAFIKLTAGLLFLLFLCMFLELVINSDQNIKSGNILGAYQYGAQYKMGGGLVGGMLVYLCSPNFGVLGSYVIDIVVLIITLVLLTEKSVFRGMKKGGKKVYDTAKEDVRKRKDIQKRKREEQVQRRADKHVQGVALDTALSKKKKSAISDEISEIHIENYMEMSRAEEESHDIVSPGAKPADAEEAPVFPPEPELALDPEFGKAVFPEEPGTGHIQAGKPEKQEAKEASSARQKKPEKQSLKEQEADDAGLSQRMQDALENKSSDSYQYPPVSLLRPVDKRGKGDSRQHLNETAIKLQQTLKNFGVNVSITNVSCGPSVTRYEIQPEMGVKVSKIVNLADDIKLNLAAADIRIEAPIPGKAAIGIEVPNKENVTVMFRELIESGEFKKASSKIAFAAGKDIGGKVVVTDIAKMPHLLIAGATGSGKSVCINTIIMSILYKAHPDEVKLIMIDPKVVELSVYNGIPHLMIPVVTDPKKASGALNWAVLEMEDRYKRFADYGVRDLKGYNAKVESINEIEDPMKPELMPQIVIIVDELADLMMVSPGEVEGSICRLAQLARAAGIHLIIATQRPSVNVITGLIKANMPSRIAFSVTSGVDSRTILDMNGAEKLLGKGDMLFFPQNYQKPLRVQGAFVSDDEVSDVVNFLKQENEEAVYDPSIQEKMEHAASNAPSGDLSSGGDNDRDVLFADVGRFLIESEKGSIGSIQRKFKVGFNRAARIMDQLEEAGIVGAEEGTKARKILMSMEEFETYVEEYV